MKKVFIIILSACVFLSCGNSSNQGQTIPEDIKVTEKEPVKNEITDVPVSSPISINENEFKQKIHDFTKKDWKYLGDKPCLVDFYADWCAPCRRLSPILEQIASEYAGKLYIYKINTDKNKSVSSYFGISSIPAVMLCPMMNQPQMMVGLYPKEEYIKAIAQVLGIQ
ncbi:MAG: thioredoxin domain-containing protein [Bacteroidales bacterium]|jgi:thioredoxin|nr:thioredoxin domain-containing protein [Bacteroidales bacterium]MDD4213886.1 thioredoxin domain-containing protein [Bacteroidales bacterium]